MVHGVLMAAIHDTDPWYFAAPAVAVAIGARVRRSRRGGGRGPLRGDRPAIRGVACDASLPAHAPAAAHRTRSRPSRSRTEVVGVTP